MNLEKPKRPTFWNGGSTSDCCAIQVTLIHTKQCCRPRQFILILHATDTQSQNIISESFQPCKSNNGAIVAEIKIKKEFGGAN